MEVIEIEFDEIVGHVGVVARMSALVEVVHAIWQIVADFAEVNMTSGFSLNCRGGNPEFVFLQSGPEANFWPDEDGCNGYK